MVLSVYVNDMFVRFLYIYIIIYIRRVCFFFRYLEYLSKYGRGLHEILAGHLVDPNPYEGEPFATGDGAGQFGFLRDVSCEQFGRLG
jgi:hypothetical protein